MHADPTTHQLWYEYWHRGKSLRELAERYDIPLRRVQSRIYTYARRRGLPTRAPSRKRPDSQIAAWIRLHEQGWSLTEIAYNEGISPQRVSVLIRDYRQRHA